MSKYPITQVDKQQWYKKVNACLMYTIPSEQQALPILFQLQQILQRLHKLPIHQTISQQHIPYFFLQVFCIVCQKIIKSRYFKNTTVLKKSNRILQLTVCLLPKHIQYLDKIPQFIDIIQSVFPDQFYFKTNNQLEHKQYSYNYFTKTQQQEEKHKQFISGLSINKKIDILKFTSKSQKFYWTHGQIISIDQTYIYITYLFDYEFTNKKIQKNNCSHIIAPYNTKTKTFQWRKTIKKNDLIDCMDAFGGWYNATVNDIIQQQNGRRKIDVVLKVYNQNGDKSDQKGKYYGYTNYNQTYDVYSPQIQPYCSVAKQFSYQSSKSQFQFIDDQNDMQFTQWQGRKIYALPRKKNLSQTIFNALNHFGQLGGFDKPLQKIIQKSDIIMLSSYLKGIGSVAAYLHKKVIFDQLNKIKKVLQKNLLTQTATYTKQRSQMLFSGLRALLKRAYTSQISYQYENNLKIQLVEQNFKHDSLKKKLHALNQLKQIIKSLTYGSLRNKKIINWIKQHKIFQKIYLINSHVQLITKSESFFRYIINQNILEIEDLQKLFKMAQKGDYQTRISLYSLFKQVSHVFKKHHVNFLIDKILQSQPNLILNEDIDLLHEISRFSNYFPKQKVMQFFQKLTLGEQIPKQINLYAIKKYSDIVSKNYEMKNYRKQILKDLFNKLKTHNVVKVSKIIKNIFEGIGVGQWGKKDLSEILNQYNFNEIILECINIVRIKQFKNNQSQIKQLMQLLLNIYKLCSSFKIQIKTITTIYQNILSIPQLLEQFYKWTNQVLKCQQGIEVDQIKQLQDLFYKVFKKQRQSQIYSKKIIYLQQLELFKSIFIQVNKRKKNIYIQNIIKDKQVQKQYKRKIPMKQLVFYQILIQFVYTNHNQQIINLKTLEFFKNIYCSADNAQSQIQSFLIENIRFIQLYANKIKQQSKQSKQSQQKSQAQSQPKSQTKSLTKSQQKSQQKQQAKSQQQIQLNINMKKKILTTLKIIQFIIDNSQKDCPTRIQSLISKKKNQQIKLKCINSVNYITDTVKTLQVTIPLNFTLYDLRSHLGKQLDIPWKRIKIQSTKQIPYELNCRTIKQLNLTGQQTLTITPKSLQSQPQQQIIIQNQINPKAIRIFRSIFDLYSTNQQMSKQQCYQFTIKCLGSSSSQKYYQEKINSLYNDYDSNNDQLLDFNDFLKFYKASAISKPSIVWSNLRSFNVKGNFKYIHEQDQQIEFDKLPRNIMSQMPQLYKLLFKLLKQKQLAPSIFNLLQRLPVSKQMQQQILSLNEQEQFNFNQIFNNQDLYIFFYKLNIIQYLVFSKQLQSDEQKDWVYRFVANKGFDHIIKKLLQFIQQYKINNQNKKIKLEILGMLIDLSSQFLIKCYGKKQTLQCQSLILLDVELNQKIQYLVTGSFTKKQTKLKQISIEIQNNLEYQNQQFTKQQILMNILDLLQYLWISPIQQSNQSLVIQYSQLIIIRKLILLIPIIQINEPFNLLIQKMSPLLSCSKNKNNLKIFYQLLICVAFYSSQQQQYQKVIINKMFKHLTIKNIISQHFSILAILVSKYGVQTQNQQQIITALIDNIFNSTNQLTIQGCSKLMLNFNIKHFNEEDFNKIWQKCLFGEQKRAKKNSTRQALYQLIQKSTTNKMTMTNYVIQKIQTKISQCVQHMRITSCNQDNQRSLSGYAGLKNLANICYINSMIQQLYMNKRFRYLLLRIQDHQPQNLAQYKQKLYDDNILHQIQRIFGYLDLSTRADFVPSGFCLAYKPFGQSVNVMIQQDVQQFVSMFFDQLQNKIKSTPFKSVIENFYGGKTTNLFNCHDCNQTKKVQQNFYSITLQVKNSKTLNDSFNRYISGELISDYKCDFCNKKVDVSKKTRISRQPRTLLIHLQRIVFNLDTFINEKITTRHQFPMNLNLYEYSLSQYQKTKQLTQQQQKYLKQSMQYNLKGIICHIGNAQSGHYISYIKIDDNKWIQFNDSILMTFNQSNIESECYGGNNSNFLDDYQWDKTTQTTKSAYILLYEKKHQTKIQMYVKSLEQKQIILKQYSLQQIIKKLSLTQQQQKQKKQQQSSIELQQQQLQKLKQQQEIFKIQQQIIRKKSQQLNINININHNNHNNNSNHNNNINNHNQNKGQQQKLPKQQKQQQLIIQINDNITSYIPQKLKNQIQIDNEIHFFERNLASPAFIKFFANLLKNDHSKHQQIIIILKNLTFGFWIKSPNFKDLLKTCLFFIQKNTKYSNLLIFDNPQIISFLIENSDNQVRTAIVYFLVHALTIIIQKEQLTLQSDCQSIYNNKIVNFLDQLFALLPTTVSKSWTKFAQYFQFWYEFSNKGNIQCNYMIRKQILKHFLDYYLDKKSPLKIYEKKATIGSKYANPNFSMLLKTVTYLIFSIINSNKYSLSKDDYSVLINFQCLQKLISQNSQNLATNLVKQICKNSLYSSQKVAIILLKGLHKSTYNNVQPYLDVIHTFLLISDKYQQIRIKWILGAPMLNLSTISKTITAMNNYSFQQRLYSYLSTITIQQASSLLDPIYQLNKRAQNFSMMSLREVLKLCLESDTLLEYVYNLPSPSLVYSSLFDFYQIFIDRYVEDSKKSYSYNQQGFNKQQLGIECQKMYYQLLNKIQSMNKKDQNQKQQNAQGIQQNQKQQHKICQSTHNSSQINNQLDDKSQKLSPQQQSNYQKHSVSPIFIKNDIKDNIKLKYFPIKLKFIEKSQSQLSGLQITYHQSQLSSLLLSPNGHTNHSFINNSRQKNIDRIKKEVWQTQKVSIIKGFYIHNASRLTLRLQTDDGTYMLNPTYSQWIWANEIVKVWEGEKCLDWPKWSLYSIDQ